MSSLKADFDELRERIRHGRELGHASFEPIYYLVFPPKQIIEVKRSTPSWISRLSLDGWNVTQFSVTEAVCDILRSDPRRQLWRVADTDAPLNWSKINQSLSNALTNGSKLQQRLEAVLNSLQN